MKLLIAADIFPPESGGPATYCVTLANELVKCGDEVRIVSLNPESDCSRVSCNLYPVTYKNKLLKYLQYFWLLLKHAKGVDVIYAMGPVNAGLPALIVSWLRRKKFVVKVVGDYAWEQGQILGLIKDEIEEFQSNEYKGKIGMLKKMAIGWGASENKIKKIHNAVQLPFDICSVEKPLGERWIVSVGRLVPWKGVEGIMRAVKELSLPDIRLKVVGDGPELGHLERLRDDLGLGEIVEFLGNIPHDSALNYMAAADLVALNSGYEGLSHTLLEARFLGRPAIASRVCGNPEVLPTDCLFPWNVVSELRNAIAVMLARPVEPILPEFAIIFSFEQMINDTKKELQDICAN